MLLSDRDIKQEISAGRILISPKPNLVEHLSAWKIDLRLFHEFYVFEYANTPYINLKSRNLDIPVKKISIAKNDLFILQPKEFVLASTIETITLPDDLAGRLEGRSSIGRLGIVVHSTASSIDPGFSGQVTLELGNIGVMPVALYPGIRICSVSFERLSSPAEIPYYKKRGAKYHKQKGPTVSKIHRD